MKRINITTGVLLVYLLVMCVWGWPGKQPDPDWVQYFRSWEFPCSLSSYCAICRSNV